MTIEEQIRQEIERRIKVCEDYAKCNPTDPTQVGNNAQIIELKDLLSFLDSLQEPGCRFPQYDNIVDKVFGAGNLESWEYSEAEQLVNLAKEELLESLQKSDKNLDEEIDLWLKNGPITITDTKYDKTDIIETAKYFYSLGQNYVSNLIKENQI